MTVVIVSSGRFSTVPCSPLTTQGVLQQESQRRVAVRRVRSLGRAGCDHFTQRRQRFVDGKGLFLSLLADAAPLEPLAAGQIYQVQLTTTHLRRISVRRGSVLGLDRHQVLLRLHDSPCR